jgi:predicted amidohydrolase YtcJ
MTSTLIKNIELFGTQEILDIYLNAGKIEAIQKNLNYPADTTFNAEGGLAIPGLNDHHIHLLSTAAAADSLICDPQIMTRQAFIDDLRKHNQQTGTVWLRGIQYHPNLAGEIDRHYLDQYCPNQPVRIQHRGGRLWILNTAALNLLALNTFNAKKGVEIIDGELSGRLYELDQWLAEQLNNVMPDLKSISHKLASYGITGLTDTSPRNDIDYWRHFTQQQQKGHLLQYVRMMGNLSLAKAESTSKLTIGEVKIHLLESNLPDINDVAATILSARKQQRNVAAHCVTLSELVFMLGALDLAGGGQFGDRIEHGSIIHDDLLASIKQHHLSVITQPHFIHSRGDQYLLDVETIDLPDLYRLQSLITADIPLAAGSDSPYGSSDPWYAMQAAINRQTKQKITLGADEALTPENALALYTSPLQAPGRHKTTLRVGEKANICLLKYPWQRVRQRMLAEDVRATWIDGINVYSSN